MQSHQNSEPLTIGELAKRSGCTVPTIRYYEDVGLLPPAARRPSGHRIYSVEIADRLNFIRRCRDFGFSIQQVQVLVALSDDPARDCVEAMTIAEKQHELLALERSLTGFISACATACAGGPATQCRIFEDIRNTPASTAAKPGCC